MLTDFQRDKFRYFFYHVLDLNTDHVISKEDFIKLNKAGLVSTTNNMPQLLQSLCKLQPFKSHQHKYCPDDCLGLIASVVVTSIYPANQALHGLVCQHNTVPGATGVRKLHKVMQS